MEIENSLDEETSFDVDYVYPVSILQMSTRAALSNFLNPRYCLFTSDGISRDWEGLIDITGDPGPFLYNIKRSSDPTQELLNFWLYKQKEEATIDKILSHLKTMDRYDVLEDILPYIVQDINIYKSQEIVEILTPTFEILTIDDAVRWSQGLGPQFYDAFILFSEVDIKFVEELVDILEGRYNLKLCVTDRDLEAGVLVHESTLKLIADRCNKLIVIMSTELFENPVNLFFCNFGVKIGMEKKENTLIGCIYKECVIPRDLNLYFMLDMERISKFGNFWEKLRDNIRPVELHNSRETQPCKLSIKSGMQKVKSNKASNVNKIINFVSKTVGKKQPTGEVRQEQEQTEVGTIQQVLPKKSKKLHIFKKKKSKIEVVAT